MCWKPLEKTPAKGRETSISDAVSDKDISHIESPRVPRHATHQGVLCDIGFVPVRWKP